MADLPNHSFDPKALNQLDDLEFKRLASIWQDAFGLSWFAEFWTTSVLAPINVEEVIGNGTNFEQTICFLICFYN